MPLCPWCCTGVQKTMSPSVPEFGTPGQKDPFPSTWPKEQNKNLAQLGVHDIVRIIIWGAKFFFYSMNVQEIFPVFST